MCPRFWPLTPPRGMDTGVRSHGMKADPPEYLWSKYECFLMSGWWDILHSSCLNVKLWSNSTSGTEIRTNEQTNERTNERTNIRTDERKDENYIPLGINAGGIIIIASILQPWSLNNNKFVGLNIAGWQIGLRLKYDTYPDWLIV